MKNIVPILLIIGLASCQQPETTQPSTKDLVDAVFASGFVVSDEEYQVTANAEGYLVERFVSEGAKVGPETPLFRLSNEVQQEQVANAEINYQDALQKLNEDSPQKAQLMLQIEQANSQLVLDQENYQRYEKLLEKGAVSRVEFDQVKL